MDGDKTSNFEVGIWAIIELMGHVKVAGLITEEEKFGAKMMRVDIPNKDGYVTQFIGGSAIYRITVVSEEVARAFAARNQPQPVGRWELLLPDHSQFEPEGPTEPDPFEDEYDPTDYDFEDI